jgi:hypothetical protein
LICDVQASVVMDHLTNSWHARVGHVQEVVLDRCGVNSSTLASYQKATRRGLRGFAMTTQGERRNPGISRVEAHLPNETTNAHRK